MIKTGIAHLPSPMDSSVRRLRSRLHGLYPSTVETLHALPPSGPLPARRRHDQAMICIHMSVSNRNMYPSPGIVS